jgi:hypothetical protein
VQSFPSGGNGRAPRAGPRRSSLARSLLTLRA